ncbi:hypothetical protein CMI37_13545 [Candidatus Pacearchaeota archaeon]|jgi:hypothetical protein|nr:hypothetical protein [Candidatus Pacearchaeota archaeon]|tara:strand:+ start:1456 stop:2001 length:546 start_codon:yes stop_codon:yes gene_type:complete
MAQNKKYNHRQRYLNRLPVKVRGIHAGMLVEFTYSGDDIFDHRPLVLVLASGYYDKKVNSKKNILLHGINFNYLTEFTISKLNDWLQEAEVRGKRTEMKTKRRDEKGRFIVQEQRYTQLDIPQLREQRQQGEPIGMSQIRIIVTSLYKQVIEPRVLRKADVYRTYKIRDVSNPRAILYNFK